MNNEIFAKIVGKGEIQKKLFQVKTHSYQCKRSATSNKNTFKPYKSPGQMEFI